MNDLLDHQNDDSFSGGESSDDECLKVDDKSKEFGEIWLSEEKDYTILKQEEVAKLQEDDIAKASSLLSVSKSDACLLLLHSNWETIYLTDRWFDDENKIREKAGLLKKTLVDNSSEGCRLCSDSTSSNISASCGHLICGDCWRGYIRKSINEEGLACLMLRCPELDCSAAVGPDLVQNVMLDTNQEAECYERYKNYLLRSYLKDQSLIKWCPASDCNHAIRADADVCSTPCYYVSCVCSRSFCFNCGEEENHCPVDCETARKWINSKYKTWQENLISKKALELFHEAKKMHQELYQRDPKLDILLDNLLEACKVLLKCRQVMRWTVVYGYYNMRDHEEQHPERTLFEGWQRHAEFNLEMFEGQVQQIILANSASSSSSSVEEKTDFAELSIRLHDLTKKTATYFKNLVRDLVQGRPENWDGAGWTCERCTYINAMSKVNCGMCTAHIPEGVGYWPCDNCTCFNPAIDTKCLMCSSGAYWSCDKCTYFNPPTTRRCSMCSLTLFQGLYADE